MTTVTIELGDEQRESLRRLRELILEIGLEPFHSVLSPNAESGHFRPETGLYEISDAESECMYVRDAERAKKLAALFDVLFDDATRSVFGELLGIE